MRLPLMVAATSVFALVGCPTNNDTSDAGRTGDAPLATDASPAVDAFADADAPIGARFVVRGVSGRDIVLDRTWDRGCVSGGPGLWNHSRRTLTGLELVTTITEYMNASTTPDCMNGRAIVTAVTEGVGASGLLTFATRTAITAEGAASLNTAMFCGITDWAPGAARDLIPCFGTMGRGTILVDDRTTPWHVYDGVGMDPAMYPTFMPTVSHQGPIEGP